MDTIKRKHAEYTKEINRKLKATDVNWKEINNKLNNIPRKLMGKNHIKNLILQTEQHLKRRQGKTEKRDKGKLKSG